MSAVERVQAAIEKLNKLKADSATGPLTHQPYGGQNQNGDYSGGSIFDGQGEYLVSEVADADGELLVTLHGTIDPLLATLERWLEYRPLQMEEPIVALADAILGEQS